MFKPIESKEHPGWYEIPNFSRYLANKKGYVLNKKTKNFSTGGHAGRYLKVSAYKDGNLAPSLYYIHVLVASAFYGIPDKANMVVMHKNNNRSDNRIENLRWGSQSENILQVYQDGLKYSKKYSTALESIPIWYLWEGIPVSIEDFDYVSVNSSNISTVGYDKKEKTLEVTFKTNSTYVFKDVSQKKFLNLVHAKSVGQYFNKNIKNHYIYQKA